MVFFETSPLRRQRAHLRWKIHGSFPQPHSHDIAEVSSFHYLALTCVCVCVCVRVNTLSTADSLRRHCKLGRGSASIPGTSVYRRPKRGRKIVRQTATTSTVGLSYHRRQWSSPRQA